MTIALAVAMAAAAPPVAGASLTFVRSDYPTGSVPVAVVATESEPGTDDSTALVVVANSGSDNLTVLSGDGSGGLAAAPTVGVGDQPVAVVAGSFDGGTPARTDLAVANRGADTVTVLLGNGSGGFTTAAVLGSAQGIGVDPSALAAADLDGDGDTDLAVANAGDDTVTVLLGDGAGAFATTPPIPVGDEPVAIEVVGDGSLYTANRAAGTLSRIATPAALIRTVTQHATGIGLQPRALSVRMDRAPFPVTDILAVANFGSGTATLLATTGSLAPVAGSPFAVAAAPTGVAGGPYGGNFVALSEPWTYPFHSSGLADFAFTSETTDTVAFLIQDSAGAFHPGRAVLQTGDQPMAISQYDLNADGDDADLAVANSGSDTVSVFIKQRVVELTRAPAGLTFALQPRHTLSAAQSVTLTNTGGVPLLVETVALTGADAGDFIVSSDACRGRRLLAGFDDSCSIDVRFAPTAAGARTASLRVVDDHAGSHTVALGGTGGDLPAGPAGAAGEDGATGPPGPTGPAGVSGPVATATVVRLQAALAQDRFTVRARQRFRVRFVLTRSATVAVAVLKVTRRVSEVRRSAAAGRGSAVVRVNKPGRYVLALSARSADGQAVSDRARLTVR